MFQRSASRLLLCALTLPAVHAQVVYRYASATRMPRRRAADSYAIYSLLLASKVVEWSELPRARWYLEQNTSSVLLANSCNSGDSVNLNPHTAIRPPQKREADFAEVLADFDAHCHESYRLDSSRFHTVVPVQLLDDADQGRFEKRFAYKPYLPPRETPDILHPAPPPPLPPDPFPGAAGLHSVSGVYFNHAHTLAIAQLRMVCGELCGNWTWVALERTGGHWHVLPWPHMIVKS